MSTSVLYHAFQIKGVKYKSVSYEKQKIVFHADMADSHLLCANCKSSDIRLKGQKPGEPIFYTNGFRSVVFRYH